MSFQQVVRYDAEDPDTGSVISMRIGLTDKVTQEDVQEIITVAFASFFAKVSETFE